MGILYAGLDYILLILLRTSALIFTSPIFGRRGIPNIVKIGFSVALAYLFFMDSAVIVPLKYDNLLTFVFLCIQEFMFGLIFAYVLNLFFTLTFSAGQLIDMQMGFGMVNVFDVQSNISIPLTGNFLNVVIILVFFAVDGHLKLVYMLYATLLKIPIGTVVLSPDLFVIAAELFAMTFVLAVNVALPIVFAGLMGEAGMGVMIKTVPQLNVFSVGFPLKILLGFTVLVVTLPVFVEYTDTIFNEMFKGLENLFSTMMASA